MSPQHRAGGPPPPCPPPGLCTRVEEFFLGILLLLVFGRLGSWSRIFRAEKR